ncbi:MAG: LysM peptidoglycan-binding domain-containing protein, partial [Armatimonadota bacterium]
MEAKTLKQVRRRFWIERAVYLSLIAVLVLSRVVDVQGKKAQKPSRSVPSVSAAKAYAIVVNGRPLVALRSEREAKDTLNAVKAHYSAGLPNLLEEPSFKEQVVVRKQAVPAKLIAASANAAAEALTGGPGAVGLHRVAPGENAWLIAKRAGISVEELAKLNPNRNLEHLDVGDILRTKA